VTPGFSLIQFGLDGITRVAVCARLHTYAVFVDNYKSAAEPFINILL
jgi:hypothetical protein